MVKIRWFGHACFRIQGDLSVVIDPFHQRDVGYPTPETEADVVLVTHDHFDHNKVDVVRGDFKIVNSPGEHEIGGVKFRGIPSYHDDARGALRGKNIIYVFQLNGITFCHLGDLGDVLSDEEVKEIGDVDVLMIPVGGHFTIGPKEATEVTSQMSPKITIPMHYKTPVIDFPIKPVDEFLRGKENIRKFEESEVEVVLPEKSEIWVLNYG